MKPILELSRKATTILLSILMLTSTLVIVGTAFHPANAASPSTPTFSNYELAGNPFRHGFSVGVSQATRSDMALASESPVQTAQAHARTLKANQQ